MRLVPRLLLPTAGFRAFAFWSHKVLRWCAPALMAVALAANFALVNQSMMYRLTLFAQCLFYALAYLGKHGVLRGVARRVASLAYYFVTMNWAIVVGFWRFLRNAQRPDWDRTARV